MAISPWTRYLRRLKHGFNKRLAYLQITIHGNKIEHLTDFSKHNLRPVLLIQGFGCTRQAFTVLERRLRKDGFDVFSLNLGGLFGTLNTRGIELLAEEINERIASLRERFKMERIDVIGFSKGGLVGRYLIACLEGSVHIKRLVTMGTPHQGLPSARYMRLTPLALLSRSIWDMHPKSSLIVKLNQHPIPQRVLVLSIASMADKIVPAAQCYLDGCNITNITLDNITHSDYLLKASVYEIIRDFLKKM